jgi:formimidoylglutamate deiminase
VAQRTYQADWTWYNGALRSGIRITVNDHGIITGVSTDKSDIDDVPTSEKLHSTALLPGFINAHSHAFQRGLRGLGEAFPAGTGDFWAWRAAMYELVESLTADQFGRICRCAFEEMLDAGITSVGEFHYFHHSNDAQDFSLDDVVLNAAREAGIRIVLLNAYYKTGGIDQPLTGGQRRFACESVTSFLDHFTDLQNRTAGDPNVQLGLVAHSIRAVPLEDLMDLANEAKRRNTVLHMHLEEQRQEIESCTRKYGATPLRILNENVSPGPYLTAVHCTHSIQTDLEPYIEAGGRICICPLTEGNLADGIANVPTIWGRGGQLCVGSDSNARISMQEELRWLEYVQRVHVERRGLIIDHDGNVPNALLRVATEYGARSLGLNAGSIEVGHFADFLAVDLTDRTMKGWSPDRLLGMFLLGADREAIGGVCVGGRWLRGEPKS